MRQEAVEEGFGGKRAQLGLARVSGKVAKCNLVVLRLDQAAVADSNLENIGVRYFKAVRPLPTGLQLQFLPERNVRSTVGFLLRNCH
jgi:hypothetical protein